MKTITEFSSIALRLANEKLQEIQRAQPEAPVAAAAPEAAATESSEAPAEGEAQPAAEAEAGAAVSVNAALAAALKMDEAKVDFLMHALKLSSSFRGNLKRVLVMTLGETETPPAGAQKIGEHYFVIELIGGPASQAPRVEEERGGRRGDKKGGGKGRGGKDGDRGRGAPGGAGGGERGRGAPGGAGGGGFDGRTAGQGKPQGPVALPKPRV